MQKPAFRTNLESKYQMEPVVKRICTVCKTPNHVETSIWTAMSRAKNSGRCLVCLASFSLPSGAYATWWHSRRTNGRPSTHKRKCQNKDFWGSIRIKKNRWVKQLWQPHLNQSPGPSDKKKLPPNLPLDHFPAKKNKKIIAKLQVFALPIYMIQFVIK